MEHADWEMHYEGTAEKTALERTMAAVSGWGAQGVILQGNEEGRLSEYVRKTKTPCVLIGGVGPEGISTVCPDNPAVGQLVANYFQQRHMPNFGFVGVAKQQYSVGRLAGFQEELRKMHHRAHVFELNFVATGDRDWMADYARLATWLKSVPKPVGVMAASDYLGRDVIWTCRRLGLRVPDDVAVVGVDNDPVECSMCPIALSSVRLPAERIGYGAAELLDRLMRHRAKLPPPTLLPPVEIITRPSSDVFAVDDAELAVALRVIRDRAGEPITVSDILSVVPLSRRALERRCTKVLGTTLRYAILRAHAEKAKRLLADTDMKMPLVSERSGFSRYQVFSRLFKKMTGMLPSEYRESLASSGIDTPRGARQAASHSPSRTR
jgi:LacI family transcriptional regulator